MKTWDLAAGSGKLELALKSLESDVAEIAKSWDDEASRQFVETYVEPLEPRVKEFLDAVRRVSEVLTAARRQCDKD
jgi:hypothetical protein